MTTRAQRIEQILTAKFAPLRLEMVDDSDRHIAHLSKNNVPPGGETHYQLVMVSEAFTGMSRVERSRAVHEALDEEFRSGLHALSLKLKTPAEVVAA